MLLIFNSSNISTPSGQATSGAPRTQGPGQPPYEANEKEAMLLSHRELEDIFNGPNDSVSSLFSKSRGVLTLFTGRK